ncbi:uncharacterized protein LOC126742793 isoform X21 [Anthonomus grandis grandis]|uniref:uncharacterized protein LOC126742793 isoform X17 n=1 Tax=Anthonomus grandis grandis TaxID=2921223 RepID=UPI0021653D80|nr:uncharacterized protein LOC126742793 isoform X17 [Anthonomus grandis grandis]XP_050305680.1 uncharacterized protein LOC126742793 isoform X18 [Anthonomus grandis grandis]XP_050305704.1 uncharacterized protein LOC126742793 isoform X21 [Anthonomus grandis grandis]
MDSSGTSIQSNKGSTKKVIYVWENGDFNGNGQVLSINSKIYRSWKDVLGYITKIVKPSFGAAVTLFDIESKRIVTAFKELEPYGKYAVLGMEKFKERRNGYKTQKEREVLSQIPARPLSYTVAHFTQPSTSTTISPNRKIMLFVLPNGRSQEMPCKVVLTDSDMKLWNLILGLIAKALNMPLGVQFLHTVYGVPVRDPKFFLNGNIYIAVPVNERFVPLDYPLIFRNILPETEEDLNKIEIISENPESRSVVGKSKSDGLSTLTNPGIYYFQEQTGRRYPVVNRAEVNTYKPSGDVFNSAHPNQLQKPQTPEELFEIMKKSYGVDKTKPIWTDKVEESRPLENKPFSDRETPYIERIQTRRGSDFYKKPNVSANYEPDLTPEPVLVKDNLVLPKTPTKQPKTVASYDSHAHMVSKAAENTSEPPVEDRPNNHRENYRTSTPQRAADKKVEKHRNKHKKKEIPHRKSSEDVMVIHQNLEFPNKSHEELEETSYQKKPVGDTRKPHKSRSRISRSKSRPKADKSKSRSRIGKSDRSRSRLGKSKSKTNRSQSRVEKSKTGRSRSRSGRSGSRLGKSRSKVGRSKSRGSTDTIKSGRVRREKKKETFDDNAPTGCSPATCPFGGPKPKVACGMGKPGPGVVKCFSELGCHLKPGEKRKVCMTETCRLNPCKKGTKCEVDPKTGDKCAVPCDSILDCKKGKEALTTESADSTTLKEQPTDSNLGLLLEDSETPASGVPEEEMLTVTPSEVSEEPIMAKTAMLPSEGARSKKDPLVLRPGDPGYDEFNDKYGPRETRGLRPGDRGYGDPLLLRPGEPGYEEYINTYGDPDSQKEKPGDLGKGNPIVVRPGDPGYEEFNDKYGAPESRGLRPGDAGYGAPLLLRPGEPGYNEYLNKYGVPQPQGIKPKDSGYGAPIVIRPRDPGYDEFNHKYGDPESRNKKPGDPGYGTPLILRPGEPGYDDYISNYGIPGGLRPGDPGYGPPIILRPEDAGYDEFNDKYGAPGSRGLRPGDPGYGTPLALRPGDRGYDEYVNKYGKPAFRSGAPEPKGAPITLRPGDPGYDEFNDKYGPPGTRGLRPGDRGYGTPLTLRPGTPAYDEYLRKYGRPGARKKRPSDIPGYGTPILLRPGVPGYDEFTNKYGPPKSRGLRPKDAGYGAPWVLKPGDPGYEEYLKKYGVPTQGLRPGDPGYGIPLVVRPGDPAYEEFFDKYGPPESRGRRPGDAGYGIPLVLRQGDPGYDDYIGTYGIPGGLKPGDVGYGTPIMLRPDDPGYDEFNGKYGAPGSRELRPGDPYYGTPLVLRPGDTGYDEYINKFGAPGARRQKSAAPSRDDKAPLVLRPVDPGYDEYVDKYGPPEMQGLGPGDPDYGKPLVLRSGDPGYDEYNKEYGLPAGKKKSGDPGSGDPLVLRPGDPGYDEFVNKYGPPRAKKLRPGDPGYGAPLVLKPGDPEYNDYVNKYGVPGSKGLKPGDPGYGLPLVVRPGDPGYDEFNGQYGTPESRDKIPGDPGYGTPLILRPGDPGYDDYLNAHGIPGGLRPGDPGYAPPLILRPEDPGYEDFNDKYGAPGSKGLRPGDTGYGTPLVLRPPDPAYDDYKRKYGSPKARASRPGDPRIPLVIRPGDPAYDQFVNKYGPPSRRGLRPGDPGYGAPVILRPGDPGYDDYLNTHGIPGGLRPGDPGYAPPLILRPDDPGYEEFNDKYGAPGSRGLRPGQMGYGTPLVLRPPDPAYDDYKGKYGSPKARASRPRDAGTPLVIRPGDPAYDQFMNKYGPPGRRGLRPGDPGYGAPVILRPGDPGYDDYLNTYGIPGGLRPGDPGYAPPLILRPDDPGYEDFNDKYGAPGSRGLRPGDTGYGTPLVLRPPDPAYDDYKGKYGSPKARASRPDDPGIPLVIRPGDPAYDQFMNKYGPPSRRGLRPGDPGYGAPVILRPEDPGYDDYLNTYGIPGGLRPGDPGYAPPLILRPDDPAYEEFNDKYGAPGSRGLRPGEMGYGTPLVLRPPDPAYDDYKGKYGSPKARASRPGDAGTPLVIRPRDPAYDQFMNKYGPPGRRGLRPGDPGYGAPVILRPEDPGYDDYLNTYGIPGGLRPGDPGYAPPLILRPDDPGYEEFNDKYGAPGSSGLRPGDTGYGTPLVLRPPDPAYDDYKRKYGSPKARAARPGDLASPLVLRPGDPGYDQFMNKNGPPDRRGLRPGDPGYGAPLILRPGDPGYDDYLNTYGTPGELRLGDPGYAPPTLLRSGDPGYDEFNDKYGAPGSKGLRPGDGGYGTPLVLRPEDPGYDEFRRKYGSPATRAVKPGDLDTPIVLRPGDPGYNEFNDKYGPPGSRGLRPGDRGYGAPLVLRPGDPGYDEYLRKYGAPGKRPGDLGPPIVLRPGDPAYDEFNDKYGAPGSKGLRPGDGGYGTPLVLRPEDPGYDEFRRKYGSPATRAVKPGDLDTPVVLRPGDPGYDEFNDKYGPPGSRGLRPGDRGYGAPLVLRPGDPGYDEYLPKYGAPGKRPGDPGPPIVLRPRDPAYDEFNDKYGAPGSKGLRPGDGGYGTPLVLRPDDPGYDEFRRKYGSPATRAAKPGDLGTPIVLRPGDPGYDEFNDKYGPPGSRGLRPGDRGYGAPLVLRPGDPGYDDYLRKYGAPVTRPGDLGPPIVLRPRDPGYDEFVNKYGPPGSRGLRPGDRSYGAPLTLRPEDPGYDDYLRKYGAPGPRPGDLGPPIMLRPADPGYDEFVNKYGPPGSRGLRPGHSGYGTPLVLRPRDPGYDEYLRKYGAPGTRPGDEDTFGSPAYKEKYESGFRDGYGDGYGDATTQQKFLWPGDPGYRDKAAMAGVASSIQALRPWDPGYQSRSVIGGPTGLSRPGDTSFQRGMLPGATGLRPGDPRYGRQARDRSPGTNGLGPDELQMLYSKPAYQHGYKAGYKKGLDDGKVASKILITPDPSLKKKETYQEPVARGCNPACSRKPQQSPPPPNYSYIEPQQQEPPPVDYSYLEPQIILMPYTAPLQAQPAPPRQQEPPPSVDYSYLEPRIILPYAAPLQAQPAQEPPPFDYSYLESQIIPPYAAPLQAQPAPPRERSRPKAPDRRSGVPPRAPREKERGDKEEPPRKPEQNVGEKDRTEDKERKSRIRPEDEPKKPKREKSDSRTRTKTREPSNESMVPSGWLCWRTKKGEKEPPQEKKERKNRGAGSSKPARDRAESRQEDRRDRSRNKNRSKSREKSVEDKSRLRREQSKRDMRNRTVESGEKVESSQPGDELARKPVREQPREQRRERQKEPSREPPRERAREQRSTRYPEKEKEDPSRTREPRKQTGDERRKKTRRESQTAEPKLAKSAIRHEGAPLMSKVSSVWFNSIKDEVKSIDAISQNESNTQESSDKSSLTNDGVLLYSSKTAPTESHLDLSEQLSRRTNNAPNTRRENTDPNMRRNKRDLEERTIVPPYNYYNDAPDIHEAMPTFEYDTTSNSPPYREETIPQAGGYYFGPNSNPRQEETVIPETWFEPKIYLEVVEPKTELNEAKPLTKGPISKSDTHAMQIQQTVNRPTGNKRRVPRGGNQQSLGIGDSTSHLLEPVCDSKCTMIPSQGVSSMSDGSSSVTSQVLSVLPSVLVYSDFIEKPHDHCEDSCLMDMKSEELKQARDLPESILPACCLKEMDREILNMINPSDDYTQSITSKCDTLCDMISTVKPPQEVPVEVHPKSCDPSCHIASEMQSILQAGPESYTEIPSTATYDSIIKPESCNLLESVMTAETPTCCDKIPKIKQKTSAILVAQSSKLKSEEMMNVNYTVLAKSREDVKMSSPKNGVDCCDDLMQGQSVPLCCARPISEEVLNVNYTVPEGDPESIHEKIKRLKGRCQVKCNYDISKTEQNTREPSQVTVKNASETAADGAVAVVVLKVRNDSKLSSKNYQLNTDISTNVPKNPVIFDRAVEVSEFKTGAIANDEDDTDQYYVPLTGSIKPSELQADQLMKALQAKLDKQLNNKENPLDDHRNSEKPDQVVPTKPDQVVPSEVDIDCNQSVPIIQRVPESLMAKYHVNETRSANLNWISVSTSDATPVVQLPPASRSSFLSNLEALVPVMDTIPEESKSPGTAVANENIRPCCIRSMTSRIRNLQRLDASVLKIHSGIVSSQMQEVPDCCEKFSEVFNDFVEKTNQGLLDAFHTTDHGKSNCCRNFLAGKNKTFESQFNREEIISSPAYVTHLTAISKSRNASWDSAMIPIDHLTPVKDSSFSEANVKTLQDTNDTTRYEDYNENALMEDVPSEQIHSSQYESNSKSYTLDEHGHIEEFEEDERRCCLGVLELKVDVPCGVYGTCPDPPTSLVDACTSDNAAEKETPSREISALTPEEFIKDIIKKSKVIIDKFNLQPKGVSEYATKVSTKEPKCPDHKLFGKGGPCCDCKKPIPQASKTTQPTPKPSQVQPVMAERSTQPRSLLVTSASVQPSPRQSREEERQSSYLSTVVSEEQRVEDYGFNLSPQSSVNHSIDADDSYLAEDRPNNAPSTSSDDPKTSTVAQIEPGTPSKASVSIQLNINHQQVLHQPTTTLKDSANDPKTSSALSVDMIIKEDSTDPRTPSINSFKVESGAASHKKTPIKHSSNDPKALSTTSACIQQSSHRPDTRHTSHDPKTPSTAFACNQPSFSSHIQENANDPKTPSITSAGIQPSVHTPSTRQISNDPKTPSIASACNQPSFSSHIQDGANDPRTLSITSAEIQLSPVVSREKTPLKHASNDAWVPSQASASVQPSFNSPKVQHNANEPRTPSNTSAGVQLTPAISQEKPAITHSTNDPMTPSESSYDAQCSSKVQTSFVNEWSKPAQVLTKAPAQPISRDFYNKEPQLINLPCSPEMDSVISCPFSNAQLQRPTCSITATLQCVPKNWNSTASDSCRRSTVTISSTHPSDRCQRKKIYCIDSPMGAACSGQSYSNREQEVVLRPAVGKCCFSNGEHLKKMSNGYCKPVQPIKSSRPLSKLKCRDQPQQSPSCLSGSKSKTVPQICHPKPEPSISKGCKGCCAPLSPICSRDKSICVNQYCKCKSNCLGTFSRELSKDCAGMSNYPIPPSCSKAGCWKTRNSKYKCPHYHEEHHYQLVL